MLITLQNSNRCLHLRKGLRSLYLCLFLFSFGSTGCGSMASAPPPQSGTAEEIMSLEREIEQGRGVISGDRGCLEMCRAASSICDASMRICEVASSLAEVEALESCRRSEQSCNDARRRVSDACTCPRE